MKNSNSIGNPRAIGLSVPGCKVSASLNKADFFYCFIFFKLLSSISCSAVYKVVLSSESVNEIMKHDCSNFYYTAE